MVSEAVIGITKPNLFLLKFALSKFNKMKSILICTFLLFRLIGCAQNTENKMEKFSQEEKEVIAVTVQLTECMISKDFVEMDKILDSNYTLTHMTGYVQPKAEWFKEVETESMKYYSAKEVKKSVKINGNKAEAFEQNKVDARIWGTRNVWNLQQIYTLEKRNGKWIILKSVASSF